MAGIHPRHYASILPGAGNLAEVMDGELAGMAAPVLTFDTVEAFTTQGGGMHPGMDLY